MDVRSSTPQRRQGSGQKQSPARLSRLQEKEELQQLNDRLAAYIQRILSLEGENRALLQRLGEAKEAASAEFSAARSLYETELAGTRQLLDRTANQRARLQVELASLGEEHRQLEHRNEKKESELQSALAQLSDLKMSLNSKDAQLTTALSEKRHLENDLSELRGQLAEINLTANAAKTQLQDEMLQRCDLENRAQTLQEKLDFQKTLHENEIKETKQHHKVRIEEFESVHQTDYEHKVAEVLQQLREDQYKQTKQYREELERSFHAKLENAQLAAAKHSDFARAAKEEVAAAKVRTDAQTCQLQQCRNQISTLQNKVNDLAMLLDREKATNQQRMVDKDKGISEVHKKLQDQLEEHEELLGVKLALDMEINAYRKMLEGEEQRLELTPSPSSRRVSCTASRVPSLRGKKRKLSEADRARYNYETREHVCSIGKIILEEIDSEGKFVKLRNISNKDQLLNGWFIRRQFEDLRTITFKFPAHFSLKAGQAVVVWASVTNALSPPVDLVWKGQRSWGTGDDVTVVLLDANGEEMAARTVVQIPGVLGSKSREVDSEDASEDRSRIDYRPKSHAENEDPSCTIM